MSEFKIFELTGTSAMGTHVIKVRATSEAQAMGMADAKVSDRNPGDYVAKWAVSQPRLACFSHEGCDGADDTHDALNQK
jgi:hypothetical protein